jgi:sugar lactone lactonase YvrE
VITISSGRSRVKGSLYARKYLRLGLTRFAQIGTRWIVLQSFSCRFPALVDSVLGALQSFALGVEGVGGLRGIDGLGGLGGVGGIGGLGGVGGRTIRVRILSRVHGHGYTPSSRSHAVDKDDLMSEPRLLATDLVIGESARWHDGRVWLSNWGAAEVLAYDLEGNREVITQVPSTIPFSIDWLPDGRLLVVAGQEQRLLRQEADGSLVDHVDLSGLPGNLNEIVVDGRGTIYVNGGNDFYPDQGVAPGFIAAITPDGVVRQVADELAFPNGMAVTDDNSTLIIAESFASKLTAFDISADGGLENRRTFADVMADGISMDAEGAVWTPSWYENEPCCLRVANGGEVLDRIPLEQAGFACALGGPDGRTLFMLSADWHMDEDFTDNLKRLTEGPRTGKLQTATVTVPSAGWPNRR